MRHWREALLALLLALPWLALLGLGFLWLWQQGAVLPWLAAAALLGLAGWPLRRAIRRRAKARVAEELAALAAPSPGWGPTAQAAWAEVQALADAAPPLGFTEAERAGDLARATVEAVARRFHPTAGDDAWARFTLPEALLLAERVARELRRDLLRQVPGVRTVRLDHALWLHRQHAAHGATVGAALRIGHGAWRVLRAVLNPPQAAAAEASKLAWDQAEGVLSLRLRAHLTRLLVLEVGRAAVDLYAGQLRLSAEEVAAARQADLGAAPPPPELPVRIVLAGQVNAGKSSLANALAGAVVSEVSAAPTPAGPVEHALRVQGRPAVVIVDGAGLVGGADHAALLDQARRADMLVWVAAATQPARAADVAALGALRAAFAQAPERRPPPVLVALTHADLLRPAAEWAPPYDVADPRRPKEVAMRGAMDAVALALDLPRGAVLPVAVPEGGTAWNVEALWAAIAQRVEAAQLRQLERLRAARGGLSLRELAEQLGRGGAALARAAWRG